MLHEMLTGARACPGEDVSETLAAVIKGEPDWRGLPRETPAAIRRLLRRCLTKDRKGRIADASILRIEIDEAQSDPQPDGVVLPGASRHGERILFLSALAVVALVAAGAIVLLFRSVPPAPEIRLEINTPPTTNPASLAISPDGRKIVFVADSESRPRLWLRVLDSTIARPLTGTDGARTPPFWSPDSRSVGFFADGTLKRIDIDGGTVPSLATAPGATSGAWNRESTILFTMLGTVATVRRSHRAHHDHLELEANAVEVEL